MLFIIILSFKIVIVQIKFTNSIRFEWCSIYASKCQICNNQTISCNNSNNNHMTYLDFSSFNSHVQSITLMNGFFNSSKFTNVSLNSLERLNLVANRISSIDNSFLNQAPNLVELNLANNLLDTFNGTSICQLQNLAYLNLEGNLIERVDFLNKKQPCSLYKLNVLNLKSNKLRSLSVNFLNRLNELRASNNNFTVMLSGNEFRCNCALLPFLKFLRQKSSANIVTDIDLIRCGNDSWSLKLNKSVLDINLDHICDHTPSLTTTTTTTTKQKMLTQPTWIWKTTYFSIITTNRGHISSRSLSIFVVCSFLFGCCLLLLVRPRCNRAKKQETTDETENDALRQTSYRNLIRAEGDSVIGRRKRIDYFFKVLYSHSPLFYLIR
jgi:hypothetical protein